MKKEIGIVLGLIALVFVAYGFHFGFFYVLGWIWNAGVHLFNPDASTPVDLVAYGQGRLIDTAIIWVVGVFLWFGGVAVYRKLKARSHAAHSVTDSSVRPIR